MKKLFVLSVLALTGLAVSQRSAQAWSTCKLSLGLNFERIGGGNTLFWGAVKGSPLPAPPYGVPVGPLGYGGAGYGAPFGGYAAGAGYGAAGAQYGAAGGYGQPNAYTGTGGYDPYQYGGFGLDANQQQQGGGAAAPETSKAGKTAPVHPVAYDCWYGSDGYHPAGSYGYGFTPINYYNYSQVPSYWYGQ